MRVFGSIIESTSISISFIDKKLGVKKYMKLFYFLKIIQ